MKQSTCYRVLFYITGLLVLALGLTLNTKTGLGVSPIISVAYSTSVIANQNFGNATLTLYSLFVIIELILHLIRERRCETASGGRSCPCREDRQKTHFPDGHPSDPAEPCFHKVSQFVFHMDSGSLLRFNRQRRRNGISHYSPDHRNYPHRNRRSHVSEYAYCAKSG